MNDKNHIILICDDAYVLPTLVCAKSIINSWQSDVHILFHICTFGISDSNIELLEQLKSEKSEVDIHIFNRNEYENKLRHITQKTHVSPAALIKFELPNYFLNYDKVLYIDSDIIAKGDLSELFNLDIEKYYMAASFDYWVHVINLAYHPIKIKNESFYFNSGVMLLNLNKMRDESVTDELWDYKLNNAKTKLMDQECFNAICGNNTLPLSIKWNFNPEFYGEKHLKEINRVYGETYSSLSELFFDVRMIHYVGKKDKPWIYEGARLGDYWFETKDTLLIVPEIVLKPFIPENKSVFSNVLEKIKNQGIMGVLYYILKKIFSKITR